MEKKTGKREEVREQCHKLGLSRVRERLSIPRGYTKMETPIVKAWVQEQEYRQQLKIKIKDGIGWGAGILGIVIALIIGFQKGKLEKIKANTYSSIKTIQQNDLYPYIPMPIKTEIEKIAEATSSANGSVASAAEIQSP